MDFKDHYKSHPSISLLNHGSSSHTPNFLPRLEYTHNSSELPSFSTPSNVSLNINDGNNGQAHGLNYLGAIEPNSFGGNHPNENVFVYPEENKLNYDCNLPLAAGNQEESLGTVNYSNIQPPLPQNFAPVTEQYTRNANIYPNTPGPDFFSPLLISHPLYQTHTGIRLKPRMIIRVDRGFFLNSGYWTCYRRNYFQLNGYISMGYDDPRYIDKDLEENSSLTGAQCEVELDGHRFRVKRFLVGLAAHCDSDNVRVDLVQHTPKRDKGPRNHPDLRFVKPSLHPSTSINPQSSCALFERLQFKKATANNGKRRATQQFFILSMELIVELEDGRIVKVAEATSSRIVVRGRSPGHYTNPAGDNSTAVAGVTGKSIVKMPRYPLKSLNKVTTGNDLTINANLANATHVKVELNTPIMNPNTPTSVQYYPFNQHLPINQLSSVQMSGQGDNTAHGMYTNGVEFSQGRYSLPKPNNTYNTSTKHSQSSISYSNQNQGSVPVQSQSRLTQLQLPSLNSYTQDSYIHIPYADPRPLPNYHYINDAVSPIQSQFPSAHPSPSRQMQDSVQDTINNNGAAIYSGYQPSYMTNGVNPHYANHQAYDWTRFHGNSIPLDTMANHQASEYSHPTTPTTATNFNIPSTNQLNDRSIYSITSTYR